MLCNLPPEGYLLINRLLICIKESVVENVWGSVVKLSFQLVTFSNFCRETINRQFSFFDFFRN